jgi:predicted DNA binding protein
MPRARLTVALPEDAWIREVSERHADATFRVLAALPDEDRGVALVEIVADDLPGVVADADAHDGVVDLDVLGTTDERAVVQFETPEAALLFAARESGVPLEPPVEIRDGRATLEVTASRERLSALGEQLDARGLQYDVEHVHRSLDGDERPLTDAQRDLVVAAVERGYYDTPRTCTLTELAEAVGVAKSTASETLHRAESEIITQFVAGLDEYDAGE